jgi:hypothetical protein
MKWGIRYSGIGQADQCDWEMIEAESEDQASREAWSSACEDYDGYAGLHGIETVESLMEEQGLSEQEAIEEYNDMRESYIDYECKPWDQIPEDER